VVALSQKAQGYFEKYNTRQVEAGKGGKAPAQTVKRTRMLHRIDVYIAEELYALGKYDQAGDTFRSFRAVLVFCRSNGAVLVFCRSFRAIFDLC
jgi:hypothetical protein